MTEPEYPANARNMEKSGLELESDIARIRCLYSLLIESESFKVLEVVAPGETSVLCGEIDFPETQLISARIEKFEYQTVNYTPLGTYDAAQLMSQPNPWSGHNMIIMHGSFAKLKASLRKVDRAITNQEIFNKLSRQLDKDGIFSGCFSNKASTRRMLSTKRNVAIEPGLSFRNVQTSLESSGFGKPRIFSLYPDRKAPISLAEVNSKLSVTYSLNQVKYIKGWLGPSNYTIKMCLSLLGLGLWFEDEYFFYARKL